MATPRVPLPFQALMLLIRCKNHRVHAARYFVSLSAVKNATNPSSDYLQTISPLPTLHFQPVIPQLPIPSLHDTCQRYLASQHAFLTQEEFNKTEAFVGDFVRGVGLELNEELMELNKKNTHTSYISDMWMDVYLTNRDSVILNTSPGTLMTSDPRPGFMNQILRATNFTVSMLRFAKTLRDNKLAPDAFHRNPTITDTVEFWKSLASLPPKEAYQFAVKNKVYPLDMSQFGSIFNATRVVRPIRDEHFKDESQRHALVLSNGHMYIFDVFDRNGSIIPAQDIHANLQYVLNHSDSLPPVEYPIGFLTTEHRDTWAKLREELLAVCKENEETVRLIDSSVLCLCLENDTDVTREQFYRRALYGNAGNRWFDKSLQLIVTSDAQVMTNMEHSWGNGVTMKRILEEVHKDQADRPAVTPGEIFSSVDGSQTVTKLDFKLNPVIRQGIQVARANHDLATSKLNVQCVEYKKFGSAFAKTCGVSPDAIAQLAMQIAYRRVTGQVPATHEASSTAMFKHGRVETIRPATAETNKCAEAFSENSGISLAEKMALVKASSAKHRQLTREATVGQGWDRHLFALRALALSSGQPTPEVFADSAYANINTITLHTTIVGTAGTLGSAFSPVSPRGLQVMYAVYDEQVWWTGTGYETSPNLSDFSRCILEVYDELYEVMRSGADCNMLSETGL